MRDNLDQLVKRLGRLVNVLEQNEFGASQGDTVTVNKTVNVSEPNDENTPQYFSTGKDKVLVTDTEEFTRIEIGFVAQTVNIRTSDTIQFAFANPNTNSGNIVRLTSLEAPFTIGGDAGLSTAFLWVRKDPDAKNDPAIQVLAYS